MHVVGSEGIEDVLGGTAEDTRPEIMLLEFRFDKRVAALV